MGDEPFERDEDTGKPVWPGDNADVATKHAYNVAMAEWEEAEKNQPPPTGGEDPNVEPVRD